MVERRGARELTLRESSYARHRHQQARAAAEGERHARDALRDAEEGLEEARAGLRLRKERLTELELAAAAYGRREAAATATLAEARRETLKVREKSRRDRTWPESLSKARGLEGAGEAEGETRGDREADGGRRAGRQGGRRDTAAARRRRMWGGWLEGGSALAR